MLSEIFYWVLNASILGSAAGLVVMVLRKIKAFPGNVVYGLWLIPLARLWLPFGIASRYSLLSFVSRYTTRTVVIRGELPQLTATNSIMGASSYFPIEYKTNLLENVFSISSVIWIIICSAAILASSLLYLYSRSDLKSAEPLGGNLYRSAGITAPAVYGIIRPRIIIPSAAVSKDIDYILMHEKVHIKRRDNLLRLIAVMTACIHWFNPLSWMLLKYFFADMELSCDARVLKDLDEKQAGEYAAAILSCTSVNSLFAAAFGGAKTRVRIENILTYKKLTWFSSICFSVLVLVIAVFLITNSAV